MPKGRRKKIERKGIEKRRKISLLKDAFLEERQESINEEVGILGDNDNKDTSTIPSRTSPPKKVYPTKEKHFRSKKIGTDCVTLVSTGTSPIKFPSEDENIINNIPDESSFEEENPNDEPESDDPEFHTEHSSSDSSWEGNNEDEIKKKMCKYTIHYIEKDPRMHLGAHLRTISRDINIIKSTQRTLQETMDALMKLHNRDAVESKENFQHIKDMLGVMPLKSPEELNMFEERLMDEDIRRQMVKYLTQIGGTSMDQVAKTILRRLMTDEVAMLYSFHGVRGKMAFKNLQIYSVIWETVRRCVKMVTEEELNKFVGTWLRHAKGRYIKRLGK